MTSMLTRPDTEPVEGEPGPPRSSWLATGDGDPMTVAELDTLDTTHDARRYELLDGTLVVTPAPELPHQDVLRELLLDLQAAVPPGLRVYFAPVDVVLDEHTLAQPDLVVVRAAHATGRRLTGLPLLAVEILSPSTRSLDLGAKHERYERAGIPSYWTVDPASRRLRTWRLDHPAPGSGEAPRYRLVADTTTDATVTEPYPVTLRLGRWTTGG